jgi:hypothetical protein
MIGKEISPILEEIENTLWEFEAVYPTIRTEYSKEGFRASIKIFMSAMVDKMWELQVDESIDFEDRIKMAVKLGEDIRKMVKTYTDIDTHDLYKTVE